VSTATTDRKHADVALENYVTETVMNVIYTFFSSPFYNKFFLFLLYIKSNISGRFISTGCSGL
jgi:hypothetical protein